MSQFLKTEKGGEKIPQPTLRTHPVHGVDPPHCADFGRVVDEADVSLGGGVQLSHLNVPEAIEELRPDVGPHTVADGDADFVILLVVFLQRRKKKKKHHQH